MLTLAGQCLVYAASYYIFIILYNVLLGWDSINIYINLKDLEKREMEKIKGTKAESSRQTSNFKLVIF